MGFRRAAVEICLLNRYSLGLQQSWFFRIDFSQSILAQMRNDVELNVCQLCWILVGKNRCRVGFGFWQAPVDLYVGNVPLNVFETGEVF